MCIRDRSDDEQTSDDEVELVKSPKKSMMDHRVSFTRDTEPKLNKADRAGIARRLKRKSLERKASRDKELFEEAAYQNKLTHTDDDSAPKNVGLSKLKAAPMGLAMSPREFGKIPKKWVNNKKKQPVKPVPTPILKKKSRKLASTLKNGFLRRTKLLEKLPL